MNFGRRKVRTATPSSLQIAMTPVFTARCQTDLRHRSEFVERSAAKTLRFYALGPLSNHRRRHGRQRKRLKADTNAKTRAASTCSAGFVFSGSVIQFSLSPLVLGTAPGRTGVVGRLAGSRLRISLRCFSVNCCVAVGSLAMPMCFD